MRLIMLVAMLGAATNAEIVDRIAATVGSSVIALSEVKLQLRVAALIDGKPLIMDEAALRRAADRLIEQALIRREMVLSDYQANGNGTVEPILTALKKDRFGGDQQKYREALTEYQVSEDNLRDQLSWQVALLQFIDFRFRPGVQVVPEDVRAYYREKFVPQWSSKTEPVPPLNRVRGQIEEILGGDQLNMLLDRWLSVTRTQLDIQYRDEAFQQAEGDKP